MTVERGGNFAAIQSLRGIAALMVVLFHLDYQVERLGLASYGVERLTAGVDIFFVISGFIMWVTTASRPQRTATPFLSRPARADRAFILGDHRLPGADPAGRAAAFPVRPSSNFGTPSTRSFSCPRPIRAPAITRRC